MTQGRYGPSTVLACLACEVTQTSGTECWVCGQPMKETYSSYLDKALWPWSAGPLREGLAEQTPVASLAIPHSH